MAVELAGRSAAERDRVLAAAAKLPPGNVRNLFEGYFPSDGRPPKLGSNPRPRAILAITGDPARGRETVRRPTLAVRDLP